MFELPVLRFSQHVRRGTAHWVAEAVATFGLLVTIWGGTSFGQREMLAIFIVIAILSLPNLGVATVIALVIMGQMGGAIIFDHFGLPGLRNVDFPSLLGALLLVVGVPLVRR